jgi:hypothetical protein
MVAILIGLVASGVWVAVVWWQPWFVSNALSLPRARPLVADSQRHFLNRAILPGFTASMSRAYCPHEAAAHSADVSVFLHGVQQTSL